VQVVYVVLDNEGDVGQDRHQKAKHDTKRSMSLARTILLTLEYDGTEFSGWQIQPDCRTIQGELIKALETILQEEDKKVTGSGRTDAGVHALGMCASFKTEKDIRLEALVRGLNSMLPYDISILTAREVPAGFCARRNSKGKRYRYKIWNTLRRPALERLRAWHVYKPLDVDAMREGASYLLGRHDFSSFRASKCTAKHPTRDIWNITVKREGHFVVIEVFGSAFLRHMVRNIAGNLMVVGAGEHPPEWIGELLRSRDRRKGAKTAPPHGLYMLHVNYDLPPDEHSSWSDIQVPLRPKDKA
tara:strand:+ start:2768 stop:3670 length:903 start_codon:yes stop_codon:yes gene_type:complete